MAVYTHLRAEQLARHVARFGAGKVLRAEPIAAGTINSIYDVRTSEGHFVLRILENRSFAEADFEQRLLRWLEMLGLPVPRSRLTRSKRRFISLNPRQHVSLFEFAPGRELAVFEVTAEHVRQVGIFLAQLHQITVRFPLTRTPLYDPAHVRRIAARSKALLRRRKATPQILADLRQVQAVLKTIRWRRKVDSWGILHGDLFIDNVRFSQGKLVSVIDWEMVTPGPFAYDLAVALCAWCFDPTNRLDLARARALVEGYESVRHLWPDERAALYRHCRVAAARFTITRIHDFEANPRPEATRLYKDYRHFLARLDALEHLGEGAFTKKILRAPRSPTTAPRSARSSPG